MRFIRLKMRQVWNSFRKSRMRVYLLWGHIRRNDLIILLSHGCLSINFLIWWKLASQITRVVRNSRYYTHRPTYSHAGGFLGAGVNGRIKEVRLVYGL